MRNLRPIVIGAMPVNDTAAAILRNLGFKTWPEWFDFWTAANGRVSWSRKRDLEDLQTRVTREAVSGVPLPWRDELEEILAPDPERS